MTKNLRTVKSLPKKRHGNAHFIILRFAAEQFVDFSLW